MAKGKKKAAGSPPEFPIPAIGPEVIPDSPAVEPALPEEEPEISPETEPDEPFPPEIPGPDE